MSNVSALTVQAHRPARALGAVRVLLVFVLAVIALCSVVGHDFFDNLKIAGRVIKFGHSPEQYLYLATFLLFLSWVLGQPMALRVTGRDVLVFVFLLYLLASWFWAFYAKGWALAKENLGFAVLAYIVIKFSLREKRFFHWLPGALILGGTIFAVKWHIAGLYGILNGGGYFKTHYNAFAFSMEAPLLIAIAVVFASCVKPYLRALAGLAAIIIATSLFYFPSRGCLLGLTAAALFLIAVSTRRWKPVVILGLLLAALAGIAMTFGSGDPKKGGIARGLGGRRGDLWPWAIEQSLKRPFIGWGPRSWPMQRFHFMQRLDPVWNHAHNEALQMWFSLGLVGLVFMVVFLAIILVIGVHNARSEIPDFLKILNLAVLAWIVCHYVHGIFDAGFSGNAKQHLIAVFMVSFIFQIYDVYTRRLVPSFALRGGSLAFFSVPESAHGAGPVEAMKNMEIPKSVMKRLLDPREYEGAYIVGELVGDKMKVLSIGGCYGRDYYYLTARGKDVICFDLAPQEHLPDLVIGDITKGTDFPDGEFDAVIMGDIIEHLFEDLDALREVRRILKDDGVLVMSVPYVNDEPPFHVRVHTEQSVRRLLGYAGFEVVDYAARGGRITNVSFWKRIRSLAAIFSKDKQAAKIRFNEKLARKDLADGRKDPPSWAASVYFGGYFKCIKGEVVDTRDLNVDAFAH
ncbi:MAG: methyltransferase domain-containing protein [Planctomycetota bacterium]|nr:MAG: methyltransferase domain-containing protein [Planctomycetota bacterium]